MKSLDPQKDIVITFGAPLFADSKIFNDKSYDDKLNNFFHFICPKDPIPAGGMNLYKRLHDKETSLAGLKEVLFSRMCKKQFNSFSKDFSFQLEENEKMLFGNYLFLSPRSWEIKEFNSSKKYKSLVTSMKGVLVNFVDLLPKAIDTQLGESIEDLARENILFEFKLGNYQLMLKNWYTKTEYEKTEYETTKCLIEWNTETEDG